MTHSLVLRRFAAGLGAAGLLVAAGCGGGSSKATTTTAPSTTTTVSAADPSSPGDIPDNQVYVAYQPTGQNFEVKVPEGWSRTETGTSVTFTDKLNSITIEGSTSATAPTVDSVKRDAAATLATTVKGYVAGKVSTVTRTSGTAILVTYHANSAPDPVTKKVIADAVERYYFWKKGTLATLTLSGPTGADNVDPWKIVTDGFRWKA